MGNDKGNEVRYIINAKGQQSANLTAKDDGPGRDGVQRMVRVRGLASNALVVRIKLKINNK